MTRTLRPALREGSDDGLLDAAGVAAEITGISVRTARRLMRRMEYLRIGKLIRVTRRALREFLEDLTCDDVQKDALKKPLRGPAAHPGMAKLPTMRPIQPRKPRARIQ